MPAFDRSPTRDIVQNGEFHTDRDDTEPLNAPISATAALNAHCADDSAMRPQGRGLRQSELPR
jgi:hypothetical protein